ncbi:MAG TPA: hypothetical protein VKM55_11440 [Candidatus Lokiarchaeia archaeon]|nr:hypothetical protein [Candidatus Lokiarchaeia archaeon]
MTEETKQPDLEELMNHVHVCIESSHNEQVQIEAVQYSEFLDKLVEMNFKMGVIKNPPLSVQKLSHYNIVIVGTPKERNFSPAEIDAIKQYVYNGGGLLVLSDQGGDAANKNNLSDLTSVFGIKFDTNILVDKSTQSEEDEQLITISDFLNHFIMRGIEKIALKSPCSIEVIEESGVETNVVAYTPDSTEELTWNGETWVETGARKHAMVAVAKLGAGKVVAIGTTRLLSTLLNKKHGFKAVDNEKFIVNVLSWLVNREVYEEGKLKSVFVNVSLKPDLYFWIENELKSDDIFRDFNEVINFSIESLKRGIDRYKKLHEDIYKGE